MQFFTRKLPIRSFVVHQHVLLAERDSVKSQYCGWIHNNDTLVTEPCPFWCKIELQIPVYFITLLGMLVCLFISLYDLIKMGILKHFTFVLGFLS